MSSDFTTPSCYCHKGIAMPIKVSRRIALLATTALLAAPLPAWTQNYPERPIKLVISYAPGGAGDVLACLMAQKYS